MKPAEEWIEQALMKVLWTKGNVEHIIKQAQIDALKTAVSLSTDEELEVKVQKIIDQI